MRFRPGQKVACIATSYGWGEKENKPCSIHGPAFNEVVTVAYYYDDQFMVVLEHNFDVKTGEEQCFPEWEFEPLLIDAVLEAELQSIPQLERV